MTNRLFTAVALLAGILFVFVSQQVTAKENQASNLAEMSADSSEVYNTVDVMPEIVGGLPELFKHIEYPAAAMANNVQGRVFIQFVVDENGEVLDPKILKDIGLGCGDAAIAAIKKVEFKPGKLQGKAVKVNFTLPVIFKMK